MLIFTIFIVYALIISTSFALAGFKAHSTSINIPKSSFQNLKLLVIGATGRTGQQIVSQALERGFFVTAFVRNRQKLQIEHENLTVVKGNVLDYSSVEAAVDGQDAVISALGHKRYYFPGRILSHGTSNILKAMEQHKVKRFICQTSIGIGNSAGRMGIYYTFFVIPLILPFYFWDKTRQEKIIAESNLNWTIVRPAALTNRAKKGKYQQGFKTGNFILTRTISRADVADFMLNQLSDNSYMKSAVGISN